MAWLQEVLERLPLPIKPPNLEFLAELNRGAFGVVYEGVFDGHTVAVKVLHKALWDSTDGGDKALHNFCEECGRLKELDHPHVISE